MLIDIRNFPIDSLFYYLPDSPWAVIRQSIHTTGSRFQKDIWETFIARRKYKQIRKFQVLIRIFLLSVENYIFQLHILFHLEKEFPICSIAQNMEFYFFIFQERKNFQKIVKTLS